MKIDEIKKQAGDAAEHAVNELKEETQKAYKKAEDAAESFWAKYWPYIVAAGAFFVGLALAVVL
jgi:glycogen debranching enzyme